MADTAPKLSDALQSLRKVVFTAHRAASESEAQASRKAHSVRSLGDLKREADLRSPRAPTKSR
jgi:phosphoglycerate dehydrogenase-like enzyme